MGRIPCRHPVQILARLSKSLKKTSIVARTSNRFISQCVAPGSIQSGCLSFKKRARREAAADAGDSVHQSCAGDEWAISKTSPPKSDPHPKFYDLGLLFSFPWKAEAKGPKRAQTPKLANLLFLHRYSSTQNLDLVPTLAIKQELPSPLLWKPRS